MGVGRNVWRALVRVGGTLGVLGVGGSVYLLVTSRPFGNRLEVGVPELEDPPTRSQQLEVLVKGAEKAEDGSEFDVVVIGGGATGSGVALDCALRGLRVALLERDDFSSGASSRSAKVIHGGVRALQKATFGRDPRQFKVAMECLQERMILLRQAPHLTSPMPTILPCYSYGQIPRYWLGLKAYDLFATSGHGSIASSRFLSAAESVRCFPLLARQTSSGSPLRGSMVYYDGQMNDARFGLSVVLTAALFGAVVANHVSVSDLLRDVNGRVVGVQARDAESGKEFSLRSTVVVNATGASIDSIRACDPKDAVLRPSGGVNMVLPDYFSPQDMGMVIPRTHDSDAVYLFPWQGSTVAGTTSTSADIHVPSKPTENEIGSIINAVNQYLTVDIRTRDVKSVWSGIRSLVVEEKPPVEEESKAESGEKTGEDETEKVAPKKEKKSTPERISGSHRVIIDEDGLVSVAGGKWTTYRRAAEDTVDAIVEREPSLQTSAGPCLTTMVRLVGSHQWEASHFTFLLQNYGKIRYPKMEGRHVVMVDTDLDLDVAKHLSASYGDQAYRIAALATQGFGKRLIEPYPVLEAEVIYALRHEMATTVVDLIAQRTSLAYLDSHACIESLPKIVQLMGEQLGWSHARRESELKTSREFLIALSA